MESKNTRRKSYGLTKEKTERISINTRKAYLEKYLPKENKTWFNKLITKVINFFISKT